jgi:hypothetical protein
LAIIHELTEEDYRWALSRVLITGQPNSGKTESSRTFKGPTHFLAYPGEGGINSIPKVDWIKPYIWKEDADARANSKSVVDEIRKITIEIITGKHGPIHTFFGDGVHRFFEYFIDAAAGGKYFKGTMEKADWLTAGGARAAFKEYLKMVKSSPVPVVVFTAWEAYEPDKQGDVYGTSKHVLPDFVGKMARDSMGEFSLVLSSHSRPNVVKGKPPRFWWQLKADNEIHGAAIKIDPAIWATLPDEIDQDWPKLEALLSQAAPEMKRLVKPITKK